MFKKTAITIGLLIAAGAIWALYGIGQSTSKFVSEVEQLRREVSAYHAWTKFNP